MKLNKPIALCTPLRTPFAQFAKSLGKYPAHHLGKMVADEIMKQSGLKNENIEGVMVGEGFPSTPNAARVIAYMMGLSDEIECVTFSQNCVSAMEAVADSTRRIALGEGQVYLNIGEESLTGFPAIISGFRMNKKTSSLTKVKKLLPDDLPEGVRLFDSLEEGMVDGEAGYGMPVTAEIVGQNCQLTRENLDNFAYESFKRNMEASDAGKYDKYIINVKDDKGNDMKVDESVNLRRGLVENPGRMKKAMTLFDNPYMKWEQFKEKYANDLTHTGDPLVTIFNACPRSDGASGIIVADLDKAKELGLEVKGVITGWAMKGVHPNIMGLGQAASSLKLLNEMGLKPEDLDIIEIHEAFASTAVGSLVEIKKETGFDWEKAFEEKKINPNGGSISIGHPFGATGIRLMANAIMDLDLDSNVNRVLITSCAGGGIGGAFMIERA